MASHSCEEKAAASAVASLIGDKWKRTVYISDDSAESGKPSKKLKTANEADASEAGDQEKERAPKGRKLQPAPFFYYIDFSQSPDDDPLAPLTPPGRVPNFPAKMHAILSRPDLTDIVAWMPHGRSWRVLKPRDFETRVIPTYFEHSKFSSFIRQANGWGFRRITQGRDRNSYYHEMFLRGLPHLCKKMKRPGVSEKAAADPEYEPDFYKISQMHPVPERAADDESIMLRCTLNGGPKARMPVYSGPVARSQTPYDQDVKALTAPHTATSLPSSHRIEGMAPGMQSTVLTKPSLAVLPQPYTAPPTSPATPLPMPNLDCLATAEQIALAAIQRPQMQRAAALQASSQFAAGFAAATAMSANHIRSVFGQGFTSQPGTTPNTRPPSSDYSDSKPPQL